MSALTGRSATRVLGALLVVLAVLLGSASTASAAASINVNPSTASPGDTVTISGNVPTDGCPASDAAQLTSTSDLFPPDGFGPQAARDASGNFSTDYAIPASTPLGTYGIGVRCGGGNVGISADLQVVAPAAPSITVNPSSAGPGDSVLIAGIVPNTGCPSGEAAQLTSTAALFPPDGFGPQVTRDAAGNFTTSYTIPASTPPGTYSIGVRCGGGNVGISDTLDVTAAATTTSSTTTSSTTTTTTAPAASSSSTAAKKSSKSALPWILFAIAAVVAAVTAVLFIRRRRSPS